MVTASAADADEVLPATSTATAVKLWTPSVRGGVVNDHAPEPLAVALPSSVPPSYTLTVLFASAVPTIVGVLAVVMLSRAEARSSSPGASATPAGGCTDVSMVRGRIAEALPVLAAASVALAVRLCSPSPSAVVRVMLQLPLPSAWAVGASPTFP